MGKKRITTKEGQEATEISSSAGALSGRKKVNSGILHVQSTFNNTILTLTDRLGNTLFFSSAGSMGFKGTKKGTPFAASKVGGAVAERAESLGLKEVDIKVCGIGPGRESSIRSFMSRGIEVSNIRDVTPMPHNGPKPKKPRRV